MTQADLVILLKKIPAIFREQVARAEAATSEIAEAALAEVSNG